MSESRRRRRIGYAFTPGKIKSFMKDSLVNHSKERGVDLICIDTSKSLIDQGQFDCILVKLTSGDKWIQHLEEYSSKKPNVLIIDPPKAIEPLRNRISMLEVVSTLKIPQQNETFGIPKQILVKDINDLLESTTLDSLNFPLISKHLVDDWTPESHEMSILFNRDGLIKLKPPVVLQEFVNHGGVIFKVYVVGDYVECVKRKSLPDISKEELRNSKSSFSFSQISNSPEDIEDSYSEVEMPPMNFISELAKGLGQAMNLHLFNFDVIRDSRMDNHYLIIDINYFPGFAKMPNYESVFTDFFCKMIPIS